MTARSAADTATRTDAALVAATLDGDDLAFAELYRRHGGAVHLAVRDRLRDPEWIADAVQEAFTQALARLDQLRDPSRFRPWLLQIARNTAIDRRRAAGRVRLEPLDTPADEHRADRRLHDGTRGPAEEAGLTELASLVRGCVAGLSTRDATAVAMATWLDLGPAEIGAALGISRGAAKVLLHRARRRLRDRLVLEVAAAVRGTDCADLRATLDSNGELAALRHARGCPHCHAVTRSELGLPRP